MEGTALIRIPGLAKKYPPPNPYFPDIAVSNADITVSTGRDHLSDDVNHSAIIWPHGIARSAIWSIVALAAL